MKRMLSVAVLCLLLTTLAAGARAEFVVETMYRESAAQIIDVPPPQDRTEDGDATLEWGNAVLAAAAMRDDSIVHAGQSGDASWNGSVITVAGVQHVDVGRTGSGDQDNLWARNLIMIRFTNPDPFVLHVEWEKTEYPSIWFIRIEDRVVGGDVCSVLAGDQLGSASIDCSGAGSYTLFAEHILSRYQSEPGERSGDLSFSITLAPEGTVPNRDETWSGVKSLYR